MVELTWYWLKIAFLNFVLSYWEMVCSFGPCFYDLLHGSRAVLSLGFIICYFWIKTFLDSLFKVPWIHWFFPVYLVAKDTFIVLPEHQELFFYFLLHHYFLNLRYVPHTCMLTSNLLDTLDWPSLSLLDSLSLMASLLLCPVNTSFLDLSRPSTLSPPLREQTRALLQFPLLEP